MLSFFIDGIPLLSYLLLHISALRGTLPFWTGCGCGFLLASCRIWALMETSWQSTAPGCHPWCCWLSCMYVHKVFWECQYVFMLPKMMEHEWYQQLDKEDDIIFKVPATHPAWPQAMHKHFTLIISIPPLHSVLSSFKMSCHGCAC